MLNRRLVSEKTDPPVLNPQPNMNQISTPHQHSPREVKQLLHFWRFIILLCMRYHVTIMFDANKFFILHSQLGWAIQVVSKVIRSLLELVLQ